MEELRLRYQSNKGLLCSNCGLQPARVKGRCRTCDAYHRATGRERTSETIERHLKQVLAQRGA
jgi:predicted ATP-dependent serine protease